MKGLLKFIGTVLIAAMAIYGMCCLLKKYGKGLGIDFGDENCCEDDELAYDGETGNSCICGKIKKGIKREVAKLS